MVKLPMGMRSWLWRARTAWWEPVAGPQSRCGSLPAAMLLLLLSTCRHNQGEFGKYRMYFQVAKEGTEIQLPCSISISLHQPFYSQSIWTSALLVWDPPIIVWPELTVVWTELYVDFRLASSNWKILREILTFICAVVDTDNKIHTKQKITKNIWIAFRRNFLVDITLNFVIQNNPMCCCWVYQVGPGSRAQSQWGI